MLASFLSPPLLFIQVYCFDGNIPVSSGRNQMDVPFLKPGQKSDISIDFVAPTMPGTYERYNVLT